MRGQKTVFGTHLYAIALAHCGGKWDDRVVQLGMVDSHVYIKEKERGILRSLYEGKCGSIYICRPEGFHEHPYLTRFEKINYNVVPVLREIPIINVLDHLQRELEIIYYKEVKIGELSGV